MDLGIDRVIDKEPIYCKISESPIINITGEGGSGKSTYSNKYKNKDNYIVVDYDLVIGKCEDGTIEYQIKEHLKRKYGDVIFKPQNIDETKKYFTIIYCEIINMFNDIEKTIVLDGTQLRFIENVDLIQGELIILRLSIETCVLRSVTRKKDNNPTLTEEDIIKYENHRRDILNKLNPLLNNLIYEVAKKHTLHIYEDEILVDSQRIHR